MIYAINIVKKCDVKRIASYRHIVICLKLDDERDLGLILGEIIAGVKDYWVDNYITFEDIEKKRIELKKYSTRVREKYYEDCYDNYDPVKRILYDNFNKRRYTRENRSKWETLVDEWQAIVDKEELNG